VPVEVRVEDIVLSMERWRWMPPELGRNHLIVNIAGFELRRFADGRLAERMNVVVGKPYSKTPVFSDRIRYLEFNPYWNVPAGIAVKEELPKLKTNPAARAAAGFEAVRGDTVYPLTSINWSQYGPGNFPFQLRQRPGPNNALGRVKFMFPNQFDVYLHDTPSRSLFDKAERAFSHGCIRLAPPARPRRPGAGRWRRAGMGHGPHRRGGGEPEADGGQPRRAAAPSTSPTSPPWVDQGLPNFRADIYGQDEKLIAALNGQALAW
jgi:murein L,D-transpeptidase YcbB/YkuD